MQSKWITHNQVPCAWAIPPVLSQWAAPTLTLPRVPEPCQPHASQLLCPTNDTLVGCKKALKLLQTLWTGGKKGRNHFFFFYWLNTSIIFQGKQWICPHYNALRAGQEWFGAKWSFLEKGRWAGRSIHPPWFIYSNLVWSHLMETSCSGKQMRRILPLGLVMFSKSTWCLPPKSFWDSGSVPLLAFLRNIWFPWIRINREHLTDGRIHCHCSASSLNSGFNSSSTQYSVKNPSSGHR